MTQDLRWDPSLAPTVGPHLTSPRCPHQQVALRWAPGRVLESSTPEGGGEGGQRPLGSDARRQGSLGRGTSLLSRGGGAQVTARTRAQEVAGAGLTHGGAGGRGGVQEASKAGSGGCGYGAAAESGTQHDGDGGTQDEAKKKPAVTSPAVQGLVEAGLTH